MKGCRSCKNWVAVEEYLDRDDRIVELLNEIEAVPVRRNKGIDGFLRIDGEMLPVPVRIQRPHETVEEAGDRLLSASRKNGFAPRILVKTDDGKPTSTPEAQDSNDERDLVIVEDLIDFRADRKKYAFRRSESK